MSCCGRQQFYNVLASLTCRQNEINLKTRPSRRGKLGNHASRHQLDTPTTHEKIACTRYLSTLPEHAVDENDGAQLHQHLVDLLHVLASHGANDHQRPTSRPVGALLAIDQHGLEGCRRLRFPPSQRGMYDGPSHHRHRSYHYYHSCCYYCRHYCCFYCETSHRPCGRSPPCGRSHMIPTLRPTVWPIPTCGQFRPKRPITNLRPNPNNRYCCYDRCCCGLCLVVTPPRHERVEGLQRVPIAVAPLHVVGRVRRQDLLSRRSI